MREARLQKRSKLLRGFGNRASRILETDD